jgi:hypothetical protein
MNGRQILSEAAELPGAFFRRCHPDRAFPLWLAKMLEFSGEEDPGHEDLWRNTAQSMKEGKLNIDTDAASAIGFLVHFTKFSGEAPELPDGGWFDREAGKRIPEVFPPGLNAQVPDPELENFLDRLLSRPRQVEQLPTATQIIEIIESWTGDPIKRLSGGGERALALTKAYYLYWTAALTCDSPPRFELWVTASGSWTPPAAVAEFAVISKGCPIWALGPPPNAGGWFMWRSARLVAETLGQVPEGSTIDLAMAPQESGSADANPAIGRALYSGIVRAGEWQIAEASPAVSLETLDAALVFVKEVVEDRKITVRGEAERKAFDATAAIYLRKEGSVIWTGDAASLTEDDERILIILAEPVFRIRFGGQWPSDTSDDDES